MPHPPPAHTPSSFPSHPARTPTPCRATNTPLSNAFKLFPTLTPPRIVFIPWQTQTQPQPEPEEQPSPNCGVLDSTDRITQMSAQRGAASNTFLWA
uniref:Uncharacterized protein n=1 Tax=Mycena chlorophos TaxID=658473 RepID=A0ABQ0KVW2_MYCCL|nr:predicted protein [Mycena chlorophos]